MKYAFGKNWERFVRQHFSLARVEASRERLLAFLERGDLSGMTFLDVGCGSGIHSLAALRAGAARVLSFDADPDAVRAARLVRERSGDPEAWEIREGSVLDRAFLDTLEAADIVYAWGVLHHTGDLWRALENTSRLVRARGLLYLALYTREAFVDPTPEFWLDVKQRYNRAGWLGRTWLEGWHFWRFTFLPKLRRRENPFRPVFEKRARGMSYLTDVRDWLGGWPMEFSSVAEVHAFCGKNLGLECLRTSAGGANTEYLLRRPAGAMVVDPKY